MDSGCGETRLDLEPWPWQQHWVSFLFLLWKVSPINVTLSRQVCQCGEAHGTDGGHQPHTVTPIYSNNGPLGAGQWECGSLWPVDKRNNYLMVRDMVLHTALLLVYFHRTAGLEHGGALATRWHQYGCSCRVLVASLECFPFSASQQYSFVLASHLLCTGKRP